jgi:phosphoglycolate phosphatase-like HAD superfamily hydrolase
MRPKLNLTPQREWDAYDAYLFDIDGTVLTCHDTVHYEGFCHALTWLNEGPLTLDGITVHGNTDRGILRDAMLLTGKDAQQWRAALPKAVRRMEDFVARQQERVCARPITGVAETLTHLKSRGAVLGIVTGNLSSIGSIKLKRSGLYDHFSFFGFSDLFEDRVETVRDAVTRLRQELAATTSVCLVGDTPLDVRAAHRNYLPAIAVASGIFSSEELAAEAPEYCVRSLLEFF